MITLTDYLLLIDLLILILLDKACAKAVFLRDELIKSMLKVANGRLTCAEALGHKEFVMTKLYRSA